MCFAFTHVASNVASVWFTCERVWHKTSKLAMRVISLVLRTRPAFLLLQPHSQAFLHFQFWSLAVYEANDGFIPGPFFFYTSACYDSLSPNCHCCPKYLGKGGGRPGNKPRL